MVIRITIINNKLAEKFLTRRRGRGVHCSVFHGRFVTLRAVSIFLQQHSSLRAGYREKKTQLLRCIVFVLWNGEKTWKARHTNEQQTKESVVERLTRRVTLRSVGQREQHRRKCSAPGKYRMRCDQFGEELVRSAAGPGLGPIPPLEHKACTCL